MGNGISVKTAKVAEICYNLRKIVLAADRSSRKMGRETGLTGPQLSAIRFIADSGPLKITELANIIQLHRATASAIADRLEAKGLIMRKRSLIDRRTVEVNLTPQGMELVRKISQNEKWTLESALHDLPDERMQCLADLLRDLIQIYRC